MHWLFRSGTDRDLSATARSHQAIGFIGTLKREAMCDDVFRMEAPATSCSPALPSAQVEVTHHPGRCAARPRPGAPRPVHGSRGGPAPGVPGSARRPHAAAGHDPRRWTPPSELVSPRCWISRGPRAGAAPGGSRDPGGAPHGAPDRGDRGVGPARASVRRACSPRSCVPDMTRPVTPRSPTVRVGRRSTTLPRPSPRPAHFEIVDVFRRAEDCPAHALEAVAAGVGVLWLQLELSAGRRQRSRGPAAWTS